MTPTKYYSPQTSAELCSLWFLLQMGPVRFLLLCCVSPGVRMLRVSDRRIPSLWVWFRWAKRGWGSFPFRSFFNYIKSFMGYSCPSSSSFARLCKNSLRFLTKCLVASVHCGWGTAVRHAELLWRNFLAAMVYLHPSLLEQSARRIPVVPRRKWPQVRQWRTIRRSIIIDQHQRHTNRARGTIFILISRTVQNKTRWSQELTSSASIHLTIMLRLWFVSGMSPVTTGWNLSPYFPMYILSI